MKISSWGRYQGSGNTELKKDEKFKGIGGEIRPNSFDEAQYVPETGLTAKMIVDYITEVKLILTGSSSFELKRQVGEPLTGRKFTI